jgi:hypothetical protein
LGLDSSASHAAMGADSSARIQGKSLSVASARADQTKTQYQCTLALFIGKQSEIIVSLAPLDKIDTPFSPFFCAIVSQQSRDPMRGRLALQDRASLFS